MVEVLERGNFRLGFGDFNFYIVWVGFCKIKNIILCERYYYRILEGDDSCYIFRKIMVFFFILI